MGRRQFKRLRIALPVTVSGHDANGNPFTQSATTIDIGIHGMRLRGVRCLGEPGEPVIVECKDRRARYRVAWIGQKGTCWEGLLGLEGLEGANFLFSEHLSPSMQSGAGADLDTVPAGFVPAPPALDHAADERRGPLRRQEERRRHVRFNCAGVAQVWQDGNEHATTGRINEISMGGCYVEIMAPIHAGTSVRLQLEVNLRTIRLHAVVRISQPALGMGIEFTRIAPMEAEKLHRVIMELSGQSPAAPATQPEPSSAAPLDSASGDQLGDAVLHWFGTHDSLNREQFLGIMEELKRASEPYAHV
jgi:hypothetical protein